MPKLMKSESSNTAVDLKDFFSATEARQDRWQQLHSTAKALARPRAAASLRAQAAQLLTELEPLESYWAYPGPGLFAQMQSLLKQEDFIAFARLTDRISRALLRGSYRIDASVWEVEEEAGVSQTPAVPAHPRADGEQRPYFEVLVVRDGITPEQAQRVREEIHKLRRPEDPFIYELVHVPSFEDAAIGVICNFNVQAVVIYDGFSFRSRFDLPMFRSQIAQHLPVDPDNLEVEASGTALAKGIRRIRPELDVYLLTDGAVESLAAQLDARNIRRVFYDIEEMMELHLSILEGVNERYDTPFFSNLKKYARRPIGTFHALPVARGKSIFKSNWIQDMGQFYGANLFMAESSATTGGLDSLLEPTGNIKLAQEKAARCFGAQRVYFGTNGTSTSNKIVVQSLLQPGDIALIDRNCHKSHHYGVVLAGALPVYLEAFPLHDYSMYGGVPLRTIKQALLNLKAEGKTRARAAAGPDQLHVRRAHVQYKTRDGRMPRHQARSHFSLGRSLVQFRAILPVPSPPDRHGGGGGVARTLSRPGIPGRVRRFQEEGRRNQARRQRLLDLPLLPDPDNVRIRVYATQSTHKSLSSLRQGSMIMVNDDDFDSIEESFEEAFFTHTSTSPNQQILASLDVARRQAELEGYELVIKHTSFALKLRREVNNHPLISKYFRFLTPAEMIPAEFRKTGLADYGPPSSTWKEVLDAWDNDEFALDPTRLTLMCGTAGFDGTQFKGLLAEKFDIQINKTSRNTILLMTNINNTSSDIAYLIKVLADIARDLDEKLVNPGRGGADLQGAREVPLRGRAGPAEFQPLSRCVSGQSEEQDAEGDMRAAFYTAYNDEQCEHVKLNSREIDDRLKKGPELVSAGFVIPYPPGFPIMVPGQVISPEIITFMRKLDVKEIHGYHDAAGLKLLQTRDRQETEETVTNIGCLNAWKLLKHILKAAPETALFAALFLGHLLGRIKFKGFSLGGVAGSLIVGLLLGQLDIALPDALKAVCFALFIYSIGFSSGPEFFGGLNRSSIKLVLSSVVQCVAALISVLVVAHICGFGKGFAAGIGAGALTETATMGTAGDALSRLKLPVDGLDRLNSQMAVGFAITYVFGTVGVIIFLRSIAPRMLGVDVKKAARELEAELSEGGPVSRPGYITPFVPVVSRAFEVAEGKAANRTLAELTQQFERASVERILRGDTVVELRPDTVLRAGDIVGLSGLLKAVLAAGGSIGPEVESREALSFSMEVARVIVTNKNFVGQTLNQIRDRIGLKNMAGVYLVSLKRQGLPLPILAQTQVRRGDICELAGRPAEVERVAALVGRAEAAGGKSDLAYHSLAIVVGTLFGLLSVTVGGIPVTLGVGGGVLVSGLCFGWLHARYPVFGALPQPAQWVLSEFGLSAFAAVIGLSAGPKAVAAIHEQGVTLLIAGAVVTMFPILVALFFGRFVLKLHPVVLLGALSGGQTVAASLSAVNEATESMTPVLGFTVTYAISNVLLAVWGPVIVALTK